MAGNTIMSSRHGTFTKSVAATLGCALLSACASGGAAYQPIVDGPMGEVYQADLAECRQVAEQRSYDNSDVRTSALIGTAFGALIGLTSRNSDSDDVLTGAAIGGVFGAGDGALKTRSERKHILLSCMAGRGHRILG